MTEAISDIAQTGGIVGWATHVMQAFGAPGAGLANAVDTVFPFVPSEAILPIAGFTAAQGRMSLVAVIVWATVGSLVGSLAVYYAGALLGRRRTRALLERIPLVRAHEIDRAEAWFARHGAKTVFFARMVPVFRSLISVPAGVERMPVVPFACFTALGSLVWNLVFILAGYWLGGNRHVVEEYGSVLSKVVIVAVVLAIGYFAVSRMRRKGRTGQLDRGQPHGAGWTQDDGTSAGTTGLTAGTRLATGATRGAQTVAVMLPARGPGLRYCGLTMACSAAT